MSFKVTPIGGVGQIGSNMLLVENKGQSVIIDCGILFPYEDSFDIRYLIPNFNDINRPESILITHGHEDHIGALAHLVEKFPGLTIYAPKFAALLIKNKFEFFPRPLSYKLVSHIDKAIELAGLEFNYIQVNHSIPDTYGIHINDKTKTTSLLYISDFKVDAKATHEPYFNFKKLNSISKNIPNKILMADSTNATSSIKRTPSETDLIPAFENIMDSEYKRVFITTFSSNIHRVKNLILSAQNANRSCVLYGRSVKNYFAVGAESGHIDESILKHVDAEDIGDKRAMIIVSGCQGDFKSTFRRIAFGQDSFFEPQKGDLFVLSSKAIPGNEKKISLCLNEISNAGADILTSSDRLIHASGHAGAEDVIDVVNQYEPNIFIPIHGEGFFLERHEAFAQKTFPGIKTVNLRNHDSYNVMTNQIERHSEPKEPIIIYGKALEFSRDSIRERRKLATTGCIFLSITTKGKSLNSLEITTQGITFSSEENRESIEGEIKRIVSKNLKAEKEYSEKIRIECRRLINNLFGFKPVVIVHAN